MLNDVSGSGIFRGNAEFLFEGFFGSVFEGPGDYLGGASFQLHYNFVQPDSRWVPYVQIGAGGFYSDIYKDQSQSLIGKSLEGGYRHVSNAGSSDRDKGLNELGVQLGFCHFF